MTQKQFKEKFRSILKTDENFCFINTKVGKLHIQCADDWIAMQFYANFNYEEFIRVTHDNSINQYSGKWNLISSDKEFNLSRLEQRLDFINRNFM